MNPFACETRGLVRAGLAIGPAREFTVETDHNKGNRTQIMEILRKALSSGA
jgi:hypothetical protein